LLSRDQVAISCSVLKQPVHSPDALSISHTLMHGDTTSGASAGSGLGLRFDGRFDGRFGGCWSDII